MSTKKRKLEHQASTPILVDDAPMSAFAYKKKQQQLAQPALADPSVVHVDVDREELEEDRLSPSSEEEEDSNGSIHIKSILKSPKRQKPMRNGKKSRYYSDQNQTPLDQTSLQSQPPSRPPSSFRNNHPRQSFQEDDVQMEDSSFLPLPPPMDYVFSKWIPVEGINISWQKKSIDGEAVIGLKEFETLVLCGTAQIGILSGELSINSYICKPPETSTTFQVTAPLNAPLPVLSPFKNSQECQSCTHPSLQGEEFVCIISLKDGSDDFDHLEESIHRRGGISPLKNFLDQPFICLHSQNHKWGIVSDVSFPPHPPVVPAKPLHDSWDNFMNCLEEKDGRLVVFLTGSRRVGKSSLNREIFNTLLTRFQRVAWLETDLGQGEVGVGGGMVSLASRTTPLIGPSWAIEDKSWDVSRSIWLGVHSPADFPLTYERAIEDCFKFYDSDLRFGSGEEDFYMKSKQKHWMEDDDSSEESNFKSQRRKDLVPLIVNTHGWNKGLGGDLIRKIQELVRPTQQGRFLELWEIAYPSNSTSTPAHSKPEVKELYPIPPSPLTPRWPPPLLRSLSLRAHFGPNPSIYSIALSKLTLTLSPPINLEGYDKLAAILGTIVALHNSEGNMMGVAIFWAAKDQRAFIKVRQGDERSLSNVTELRGGKGRGWIWDVPEGEEVWREGEKAERRRAGVRRWGMS